MASHRTDTTPNNLAICLNKVTKIIHIHTYVYILKISKNPNEELVRGQKTQMEKLAGGLELAKVEENSAKDQKPQQRNSLEYLEANRSDS